MVKFQRANRKCCSMKSFIWDSLWFARKPFFISEQGRASLKTTLYKVRWVCAWDYFAKFFKTLVIKHRENLIPVRMGREQEQRIQEGEKWEKGRRSGGVQWGDSHGLPLWFVTLPLWRGWHIIIVIIIIIKAVLSSFVSFRAQYVCPEQLRRVLVKICVARDRNHRV